MTTVSVVTNHVLTFWPHQPGSEDTGKSLTCRDETH
jgi:hypothetical protein